MTKFIIYQLEEGGIGYKPAKVNLPVGSRICLDREKMKFAKVEKVVDSTPEQMKQAWNVAKAQNKYFETSANFKMLFVNQFE